jgi:demethylmenaquinone methyltransferase/2-methoxy-6-polyprenyl-1,4-benzoquinol methylase/phosphoethanolamine N-methyltransferase
MQPETAPPTASRVLHWARWYDLCVGVIPFMRAIREELLAVAAPAAGEHALDVGCGTGTLAVALKRRVGTGEVHGIDASPEMIAVARAKAAQARVAVDFRVALVEALPFPAAGLDLVTSSLMLHHLPEDVKRRGLAHVRRVLRPGGRFVAVDFAAQGHSRLGHLLSLLGHAHGAPTVDTLTPMLRDAGFDTVEVIPTRHRHFAFMRAG